MVVYNLLVFTIGLAMASILFCLRLTSNSTFNTTFSRIAERNYLRNLTSVRSGAPLALSGDSYGFLENALAGVGVSRSAHPSRVARDGPDATTQSRTVGAGLVDHQTKAVKPELGEFDTDESLSANGTQTAMLAGEAILNKTARVISRLDAMGATDPGIIKELFDAQANLTEKQPLRGCVKSLHLFLNMKHIRYVPELNDFKKILLTSNRSDYMSDMDCRSSGYKCDLRITAGDGVHMLKGKDAVIFGMSTSSPRSREKLKRVIARGPEHGQTWIYYSTEPPMRVIRWQGNMNIKDLKYHALMTYSSESEIPIPFGYYRPFKESEEVPDNATFLQEDFYNRTGLISWVATNCMDVFWPRMPFIQQLKGLLPLDDYGKCGTKECLPRRSEACNKLFASYKFFLAVPNSECNDYITEKFWMVSLKYGVVPVALGARKSDYDKVAPPNSFVHFGDFETFADLADHLKQVDKDEAMYRKYHEWRRKGEVVLTYPLKADSLCRTLPHIRKRKPNEFRYLGDSPWFQGCRTIPTNETTYRNYTDIENWSIWR